MSAVIDRESMAAEEVYLPLVECQVSEGFIDNEVTIGIQDAEGNFQYLRLPKYFVNEFESRNYLSVGIVDVDYKNRRALVELPQESDSGANRLWVAFSNFRKVKN